MLTPVFQFSVGILIQPSILHLIYVGSALPASILFVEWAKKNIHKPQFKILCLLDAHCHYLF